MWCRCLRCRLPAFGSCRPTVREGRRRSCAHTRHVPRHARSRRGRGWRGGSSGSALTIPAPVSADKPMPTAIAAALAARLRSVVFRSCLRLYAFNMLARGYPENTETNPATARTAPASQPPTVKLRPLVGQREKARPGQLGGGAAGWHCGGYTGTPPPPLGPPGPWRPPSQHFLAGMCCGGP